MAARNCTRRTTGTREECVDLKEIDREATNIKIKDAPIFPGDGKVSCGEAYFKVAGGA
jgi:hypothetical protein